jgi:hypothetical protein
VDLVGLVVPILAAAAGLAGGPTLDPEHLPALPPRGFARDLPVGVQLETMRGRPIGLLRGLRLAPDKAVSHNLLMRRGRLLFTLDLRRRRVHRYFEGSPPVPGCRLTDAVIRRELWACKRTVRMAVFGPPGVRPSLRTVARAPGPIGHWVWAGFAPGGRAILAQWSAECEVPVAYLVAGWRMRPYGAESVALGWLPSGAAVIHFPNGPCAGSDRPRGIYAVPRSQEPRLILRTARFASYAMWGG